MHQYRIVKLVKITNADTLTVELDLGFHVRMQTTFKVARVEVPELDLDSDTDPVTELRQSIIQWFRTAPRPWTVQMYKDRSGLYTGDVYDNTGKILTDDLVKKPAPPIAPVNKIPETFRSTATDETAVISYGNYSPETQA